MVRIENI